MTYENFVKTVRDRVYELVNEEGRWSREGPSFTYQDGVARWRLGYVHALVSASPESGPHFGYVLVLARDPNIASPLGAQSTAIPFALEDGQVETIAGQIVNHFLFGM